MEVETSKDYIVGLAKTGTCIMNVKEGNAVHVVETKSND